MQNAIMACMRDEGLFVVEWAAYHRLIGFDRVFIVTNDCSDGTDLICDRLQALGQVTHIRNDDHGATPPQIAGVAKVLTQPGVPDLRWLLHIDADEFLNIHDGMGHLSDWLPRLGAHDAVAVTWRLFGDDGLTEWPQGGLQTETLTMAAASAGLLSGLQKTMFRPAAFGAGIDHMPKAPRHDKVTLANAAGRSLHPGALYHPTQSDHRAAGDGTINRKRHFPWEGAVINHYAVRTQDLFLLKNWRGDAMNSPHNKRYTLNSRWHRAANCNDVEEVSIQRHLPGLRALMAEWRAADPDIARIEEATFARIAKARRDWLTPETIAHLTNPLRDA